MGSYVILCCLRPFVPLSTINEDLLTEIFQPYGKVKSLHIFSRRNQVKAFAEFSDEETLKIILEKLHNVNLPIGKLKVYKSQKEEVIKKNPKIGKRLESPANSNEGLSTTKDNSAMDSFLSPDVNLLPRAGKPTYPLAPHLEEVSASFNHIERLPKLLRNPPHVSQLSNNINFIPTVFRETAVHPMPSSILLVDRVNISVVNCSVLRNLFGCYGNVLRVLLHQRKEFALVQMETPEQAKIVLQHLNGLPFFNYTLQLRTVPCSHHSLNELYSDNPSEMALLEGNSKLFRYKKGLLIKVNPLSKMLHFTSISDAVTPMILYDLLRQINEPTRIVQLSKRGLSSKMFLIEFESIVHSTEVLAVIHNKLIDQKMVKASFSQTKID